MSLKMDTFSGFTGPESKHPGVQSPVVQGRSIQASRVQSSRVEVSRRPESKRSGVQSHRVQLFRYPRFIDMFDTVLITTLFLLASLLVFFITLRLSINIQHVCLFFHFFHSLPRLRDFFRPPPFILTLPPVY